MAAKNEADNSEEPAFVQRVNTAASQLHSGEFTEIFIHFDPRAQKVWSSNYHATQVGSASA
jgi:TorA maturation chaperone TorD